MSFEVVKRVPPKREGTMSISITKQKSGYCVLTITKGVAEFFGILHGEEQRVYAQKLWDKENKVIGIKLSHKEWETGASLFSTYTSRGAKIGISDFSKRGLINIERKITFVQDDIETRAFLPQNSNEESPVRAVFITWDDFPDLRDVSIGEDILDG